MKNEVNVVIDIMAIIIGVLVSLYFRFSDFPLLIDIITMGFLIVFTVLIIEFLMIKKQKMTLYQG